MYTLKERMRQAERLPKAGGQRELPRRTDVSPLLRDLETPVDKLGSPAFVRELCGG